MVTAHVPVRYRCEIKARIQLAGASAPSRARILELSETGAFIEEVEALEHVQLGESAILSVPLPGGDPWKARVTLEHSGRARVELKGSAAEHLSVSLPGFEVRFVAVGDDELERLRGFLELLDTR